MGDLDIGPGPAPGPDPALDALDDEALVRATLRQVMGDRNAPAAARAQAARTMAEMVALLGANRVAPPDPGRGVATLSRAELEAELAAIRTVR